MIQYLYDTNFVVPLFQKGCYESVMNQMFVKENAPFYRFARIIHLGYIDFQPFFSYIKRKLNQENVPYIESELKRMLRITRGHPYYSQLMLQEYIFMYELSKEGKVPSVNKLVNHILLIEKNYLEQFWETISSTKEERIIITTLAGKTRSLYSSIQRKDVNVARGVNGLIGKGVVFKEKTRYILADPFFELWIQRNVLD